MDHGDLIARYRRILATIRDLSRLHGRLADSVHLLAVSKGHGAEAIEALFHAGQVDFGENYVQELETKAAALRHLPIRWHFIGHLQSNKIPRLATCASSISTIASLRHAGLVARALQETHGPAPLPVFVEVNADAETGKAGCTLAEAIPLAESIAAQYPILAVQGLFAIPHPLPAGRPTPTAIPPAYAALRQAANHVGRGQLSLGMSDDMPEAIAAGSNWLRIGTAIFGPRPPKATTLT